MAELNDNCSGHNFYLSLIVNNYMDFTAKIAFSGVLDQKVEEVPYYALNNEGKQYVIEKPNFILKKEKMYTYDCIVVSPIEQVIKVDDEFGIRVAEIMKPKPKPIYNTPVVAKTFEPKGEWVNGKWIPNTTTPPVAIPSKINNNLDQAKLVNKIKHYKIDDTKLSNRAKKVKNVVKGFTFEDFEDLSDCFDLSLLDKFVVELLKFTSPADPDENIEDALVALEDLDLDAYTIASSILENYTFLYDKHFADATDDEFINDTEEVIAILMDEVAAYPFINVTIEAISAMIVEFQKSDVTV